MAAHDSNYLHMKGLLRLARLAQSASDHPEEHDELLLWANEVVAGPRDRAGRHLDPPGIGSPPPFPSRRWRCVPVRRGAPTANSRHSNMSLGVSNDDLQLGSSLFGLGDQQQAGPLMATS